MDNRRITMTKKCALELQKQAFRDLPPNPFGATVKRGSVYSGCMPEGMNTDIRREKLREILLVCENQIIAEGGYLKSCVPPEEHSQNIVEFAKRVSKKGRRFLLNGRFRIGSAQKYLNLRLKEMWCRDNGEMRHAPPHCPFDYYVLRALGSQDSWTFCDSIDCYNGWVQKFSGEKERELLAEFGLQKCGLKQSERLAVWELYFWNS